MLNKVSLNTIGLNRIGLNRIGKPSRASSDRPYIDPEVLASLKAVCICYGKSNDDPDRAIVKNLVDPDNPFVISNAAFKLNSGFGKYEVDFTSWIQTDGVIASSDKVQNSITGRFLYFNTVNKKEDVPSFKVNITLGQQGKLQYNYIKEDGTSTYIVYSESGIYTIPASYFSKYTGGNAWFGFYQIEGTSIIKQIPSFEGAFVTDGIDDTIISTKTLAEMGITDEVTVVSMVHQISLNPTYNNGFTNYIENLDKSTYVRNNIYKAGKTGIYGYSASLTSRTYSDINNILGDKKDYGTEIINRQNTLDRTKFSVVGRASNISEVSSIAWYWTIIANKVLTTDQINQVIAYFNLDRTLNPDILCNTIKQGITNENHAEFGDKLIDFSGNGRDIQMYNLAWNGDSGIGDYEVDFTTWNANDGLTVSKNSFSIKSELSSNIIIQSKKNYKAPSFKIKIKGLPKGGAIQYRRADKSGSGYYQDFDSDGDYECMAGYDGGYSSFMVSGDKSLYVGVTVEQISSKIGALCLDGVNDFGKVTGMPIYKDYTFIAEREFLSTPDDFVNAGSIVSKMHEIGKGSFIFETFTKTQAREVSFSSTTDFDNPNTERIISYQSKYSYNGKALTAGQVEDRDVMWLGTIRDNDTRFVNAAIYSLMLFPYSMSEFLIERQLKKHKLGTLYPDMVEFRPIVKGGSLFKYLNVTTNEEIFVGDYIHVGDTIRFYVSGISGTANEVSSFTVNGVEGIPKGTNGDLFDAVVTKSPQKINITIDEYIRYEDIVQPYPVLLRFNDENGNEVSWGGKFRVGSTITRIDSIADPESNLLNGLYSVSGLSLNGKAVTSSTSIVEKQMVFKTTATYLLDNNEPKCILSPRLLRIPNSSYKILGHIPDISGHGNHGVIHNSAYTKGSGVNEDGSYQFDGVDDFVTIPTLSSGGKQVLMKVNWESDYGKVLYDQRLYTSGLFAIIAISEAPAYETGNGGGKTYIDGILNKNILSKELASITHNITLNNNYTVTNSNIFIGTDYAKMSYAKMALYDFMLFDNISTDDKIKELNEYVGIEGNTDDLFNETN